MLEREQTLKAEVQEAKDQSELLEFRVLELEECQEKEKVTTLRKLSFLHVGFYQIKTTGAASQTRQDIGTETDWEVIDSGCSSLRHSRSSSVTTELEEYNNQKPDFGVNIEIKHDHYVWQQN